MSPPLIYEGSKKKLSPEGFKLNGLGAAISIGSQQIGNLSFKSQILNKNLLQNFEAFGNHQILYNSCKYMQAS
jgi:hypothetical protein